LKKENTPIDKWDEFWWSKLGISIWFVWIIVFMTLVTSPAQYPAVHSQMEAARLWVFKADMDFNGLVTISDTWLWFKWLFFYPGDFLILAIMKFGDIQTFLELSASTFGNWFSGIISFIFWLHPIVIVVLFLNFLLS
jgi:hypothetical protein